MPEFTVMMSWGGSIKIVNFITPGAGVVVLVCGHISHIVIIRILLSTAEHRSERLSMYYDD